MPDPNLKGTASSSEILNRASRAASSTTQSVIAVTIEEGAASLPSTGSAGQLAVTTSAVNFPSVALTQGALITNTSLTNTMYVGFSNAITTTSGTIPVLPGATISVAVGNLNAVWAISSVNLTAAYIGS